MKKSLMSVKEMKALYLRYDISSETWDMMYEMACHGLISSENWGKFFSQCKGLEFSEKDNSIVDEAGKVVYVYDEKGYLVGA